MCFLKRKTKNVSASDSETDVKTSRKRDVMDRSLRTKSMNRAKGINRGDLNAGSPHDWEDLDRYLEDNPKQKR